MEKVIRGQEQRSIPQVNTLYFSVTPTATSLALLKFPVSGLQEMSNIQIS